MASASQTLPPLLRSGLSCGLVPRLDSSHCGCAELQGHPQAAAVMEWWPGTQLHDKLSCMIALIRPWDRTEEGAPGSCCQSDLSGSWTSGHFSIIKWGPKSKISGPCPNSHMPSIAQKVLYIERGNLFEIIMKLYINHSRHGVPSSCGLKLIADFMSTYLWQTFILTRCEGDLAALSVSPLIARVERH